MGRPKLYKTGIRNLRRSTQRNEPGITVFYGDFMIRGKRHYPRLGRDQDAALLKLFTLIAEARRKSDDSVSAPGSLSDLQERHREQHGDRVGERQRYTWELRDRSAVKGLKKALNLKGAVPYKKITRTSVVEWARKRRETRAASTVNLEVIRLGQVLQWAVDRGWLKGNPAKEIPYYRVPESRIRYLKPDEEERIKAVATPEQFDMVRFAYLTGLRSSEMLNLRWAQIQNGQIHLEGSKTKSHRRRVIPINKPIQEILDRRPKDNELVFPSPKRRVWTLTNFRRRFWRKLFDAAKVEGFVWHDLRHTFCSRLVMAGKKLVAVRELAGHKRFETTLKYAHLAPDYLRETMDALT